MICVTLRFMNIKTAFFIITILISPLMLIAADAPDRNISSLIDKLGTAERRTLESERMIFRYDEEMAGPVYNPESEFSDRIDSLHKSLEPEVMVEALYIINYPEDFPTELDEIKSEINKLTHRISSISGAMYFSRTEQDYSVLFKNVYAVEGLGSRKKIADPPVYDEIPAAESIHLHMDEHSMGRGYYRMDYFASRQELAICLTNTSAMSKFIKAVDKEDMKIFLQIIPCSDALLIYGYCGIVLQNDRLINLMMDPYYSFYRRMTAIETWLYNSLHGSEILPPLFEPMP